MRKGIEKMATIQIDNDRNYGKALRLLYEMGGIVRTKPVRRLVVGPAQIQMLRTAGLVPKPDGTKIRMEATALKQLD